MAIRQFTGKHEYLFAARQVRLSQLGPWQHLLKGYAFSGVVRKMQRQPEQACGVRQLPDRLCGVDHDPLGLGRLHLPRFDQNGASLRGSRRVTAARRVADIGALAIVAAFVREHA